MVSDLVKGGHESCPFPYNCFAVMVVHVLALQVFVSSSDMIT